MANIPEDTHQPEKLNTEVAFGVLIMTANDTEDIEFFYPYYRFIEAGYKTDVVTPNGGAFAGIHKIGLKKTKKISDVLAEDYELLYIPGGKAPAALKQNKEAIALVKRFVALDKPIAAVCHGPQLLAAADVIKGKRISGWPEIENEIKQAGATYVNEETVSDGLFITARWPGDLPAHLRTTLAMLNQSTGHIGKSAAA